MLRSAKRYFLFVPLSLLMVLSVAAAETVKVGIPSLTVTMLPLAVAKERGYFQQEGLSVDLVLMPAALNIKVLLGGELDYATTVGSAVVAAVRGIDTRVVTILSTCALSLSWRRKGSSTRSRENNNGWRHGRPPETAFEYLCEEGRC